MDLRREPGDRLVVERREPSMPDLVGGLVEARAARSSAPSPARTAARRAARSGTRRARGRARARPRVDRAASGRARARGRSRSVRSTRSATSSSSTARSPSTPIRASRGRARRRRSREAAARARSFTRLLQLRLERVAVHPVVVAAELVDEVLDLEDRVARDDPERSRLAAAAVLLVRVASRERLVRRDHRARVLRTAGPCAPAGRPPRSRRLREHRLAHPRGLLARARRNSSRSAVFGPCPVTTARSSSQSGSVYSQTPVVVLAQLRVGHRQAELPDLRHVAVEELLARLLVAPGS